MKHYSKEFKEEALKLSDEIGVKKAAQQLGVAYYTLADWRSIRRNTPPAKTLSAEEQTIRIRELERENAELRTANNILKDALGFFAQDRKGVYTAKDMCRVLHLSESGYYRWLRNRGRHSSRQLLAGKVKKILEEHPDNRNYGVDRVCLALERDGVDVSRRTVYRVMKENGWLHHKRHRRAGGLGARPWPA